MLVWVWVLAKNVLQIHQVLIPLITRGIIELNVSILIICGAGFPFILTLVSGNNSFCWIVCFVCPNCCLILCPSNGDVFNQALCSSGSSQPSRKGWEIRVACYGCYKCQKQSQLASVSLKPSTVTFTQFLAETAVSCCASVRRMIQLTNPHCYATHTSFGKCLLNHNCIKR